MTRGVSDGPNSRPLNDTVAQSGPGIPDDAVGEGRLSPADLDGESNPDMEALRNKVFREGANGDLKTP